VDRQALAQWLDRYLEAWRTNDREAIGALFSHDAQYRFNPHEEPVQGRAEIVESWLEEVDEPGSWRARYEPFAVDGDACVAVGESTYLDDQGGVDRVYDNCFVMRFDDEGRCCSFTEWYRKRPQ
jgi:ketosteroid isomerase-like protein